MANIGTLHRHGPPLRLGPFTSIMKRHETPARRAPRALALGRRTPAPLSPVVARLPTAPKGSCRLGAVKMLCLATADAAVSGSGTVEVCGHRWTSATWARRCSSRCPRGRPHRWRRTEGSFPSDPATRRASNSSPPARPCSRRLCTGREDRWSRRTYRTPLLRYCGGKARRGRRGAGRPSREGGEAAWWFVCLSSSKVGTSF